MLNVGMNPLLLSFPTTRKLAKFRGESRADPQKVVLWGKLEKNSPNMGCTSSKSTATHVREVDAVVVSGDLVGDSCAVAVSGGDGDGGGKKQHFKVSSTFLIPGLPW